MQRRYFGSVTCNGILLTIESVLLFFFKISNVFTLRVCTRFYIAFFFLSSSSPLVVTTTRNRGTLRDRESRYENRSPSVGISQWKKLDARYEWREAPIENGITRNLSTFVRAYHRYLRLAIVCRLEFYGRRQLPRTGRCFV